jgi:UDP-N-acetyl-D-galactosamine dehydrogenase
VDVFDPWASVEEVKHEYKVDLIPSINRTDYDAVVVAVAHDKFNELDINSLRNGSGVLYDIKSIVDKELVDGRL